MQLALLSFQEFGRAQIFGAAPEFIGIDNYVSVLTDPEFWAVLDRIGADLDLTHAGLMKRIDERRGRTPLASACRLLALAWAGGDRSFAEHG